MNIIEQLDSLHAKATPGEWEGGGGVGAGDTSISCRCCADPDSDVADASDALIAALHNAYPAISRVLKAAQAFKAHGDASEKAGFPLYPGSVYEDLDAAVEALEKIE